MSFFTDAELGALSIKRTILHVVSAKDKFQPQRELTGGEHLEFFLDRIIGSAISSVHRFEENSGIKAIIARMAKDEVSFEKGAQELSRQFSKDHVRSANNGAFFVFELSGGDPNVRLYSLIKYDYRPVIELYADKGRNALRQIVQAFIKEKRAIQKSCLVRAIGGEVDAEVSTFDRMGDAPDLTDYFAAYLDVVRDRDDAELSTRLNEVIRKTLQTCRDLLPNADVPKAVAATKDSLRGRDTVDEDAIREAIFVASGTTDEPARAELEKVLNRQLKDRKLVGVSFKPTTASLRRAPRQLIKTAEDVVLEYPGEQENRAVTRVQNGDGGWTITIKTSTKLVEDVTIADKTR